MLSGPYRRHRARPVGDAPIDPLLANVEELAKAWLLALLQRAPLEDASRILAAELARDGPRVLDAVIRAIGTDADQRRLEPGGPLVPLVGRVGELAGAASAEAVSEAVDALGAVIWAAVRAELRDPEPELVSELAERLAQVAGLVRAAALRHATESGQFASPASGPGGWGGTTWGSGFPRPDEAAGPPPDARVSEPFAPRPPSEPLPPRPASEPFTPRRESEPFIPRPESEPFAERRESEVFAPRPASEPSAPPTDPAVSVARITEDPPSQRAWLEDEDSPTEMSALWVRALAEEIDRAGGSLSLVLAELEDARRVRAVEDDQAFTETLGEFNQALRQAVRHQDLLVCDTPARAWIIARETGRGGARALAQRITAGLSRSQPWRGVPLAASIGIAVLGEDGETPGQLMEAAEEARFAADASGRPA